MPYSIDSDLQKVQKNIMSLDANGFLDHHIEAELIIDRDIENDWFFEARDNGGHSGDFDSSLILPQSQLKRLSTYKAIELIYMFMAQNSVDDPFVTKSKMFADRYKSELLSVIANGIAYDWSGDGSGESVENQINETVFAVV